jgi:hypothetical protein
MIKRSWGCPIAWSWMILSDLASPTDDERSTPGHLRSNKRRYALRRARRSFDQHRRTGERPQAALQVGCCVGTNEASPSFQRWAVLRPRKKRPMDPHERPVVTDNNKVAMRAGSTGNNVRYVLIASTALVIVAFIAIALFVKP